jgi:RNA polymerase sigma factor (sigma-70 family)
MGRRIRRPPGKEHIMATEQLVQLSETAPHLRMAALERGQSQAPNRRRTALEKGVGSPNAMMTPSFREELILSHMPQVKLLAQRLHRRCPLVELDDLISAGTIGLIQAVDRFDPARNLKLKTLAEHRINGALLDYLRHIDPLPRSVRRFQKQRDAIVAQMSPGGEVLCHARLAQLLGVSFKKYVTLSRMIAAAEPVSAREFTVAWELAG